MVVGNFRVEFNKIYLVLGLLFLFNANILSASTIYGCNEAQSKCVARLSQALEIGSHVRILDEKAHLVAEAKILKKKGNFAVLEMNQVSKKIRKGYPIIGEGDVNSSNLEWGASFSDKDY